MTIPKLNYTLDLYTNKVHIGLVLELDVFREHFFRCSTPEKIGVYKGSPPILDTIKWQVMELMAEGPPG